MLAIFHKTFAHPPQELNSPTAGGNRAPKNPEEILKTFHAAHPEQSFLANFSGGAALACTTSVGRVSVHRRYIHPLYFSLQMRNGSIYRFQFLGSSGISMSDRKDLVADADRGFLSRRLFCSFDEIYCLFFGSLDNLCALIRQYGLSKATNEALLVIEAYRTLRDRGPYPADQVVKDLNGSFAFIVYDNKAGTVFAALVLPPFSFLFIFECISISGALKRSLFPFRVRREVFRFTGAWRLKGL